MKVVIIDDSAAVRERLVIMISDLPGLEVSGQAEDVQEGIRLIRELKPDVVLLDIRMREGSGFNVLKYIRNGIQPKPLVVVITNYPYPQYQKKCLENGADYFLDKSSEFEKIVGILQTLIKSNQIGG
jgi:DNA-binding NarL/FixJ family response regulator